MSPRDRRELPADSGVVLIYFALLVTVFLALAAFAVDIGRWYVEGAKEQKAADAAALAAAAYIDASTCPTGTHALGANAPFFPGACQSFQVAGDFAARNGYTATTYPDGRALGITASLGGSPKSVTVTITRDVPNFFASAFGFRSERITRSATAQYAGRTPMGSPCNTFGNQPPDDAHSDAGGRDFTNAATCPNGKDPLWVNIAGPGAIKDNGDQYASYRCPGTPTYGCSTSNGDYARDGYYYTVRLPAGYAAGGKLAVQVYDPGYVYQGDTCSRTVASPSTTSNPHVADPTFRYTDPTPAAAGQSATNLCAGDQRIGSSVLMTTTYEVLSVPRNADPAAQGTPVDGCTWQIKGFDGDLHPALTAADPGYQDWLARTFRQWFPLCAIAAPDPAQDYVLWIRTNVADDPALGADPLHHLRTGGYPAVPAGSVPDLTTLGGGHNRLAIRAGIVDAAGQPDLAASAGIATFAPGRMSLYANTNGPRSFYLARVLPGFAGKTLRLDLFDIGDATQGVDLAVALRNKPVDCAASNTRTATPGPSTVLTPCAFRATYGSNNGSLETLRILIPQGYTCDETVLTDCWVTISYSGSGTTTDTTTWSASIEGDPIRLVR